jgi:APA family basic amino acid/polyamine antiporter
MPVIFIAAYLFVGTSIAIITPKAAWVSGLIFAVFFVIYFLLQFFKKSAQPN